jgi:hypothetical protein
MNIPVNPVCHYCKEPYEGSFILGANDFEWDCAKCSQRNIGILDLDMTIGVQVWIKSSHELTHTKDSSMAVILAATAIDSELSCLFRKWMGIAKLQEIGHLLTDEECEELLRKFPLIEDKFKKVTKLLVPPGFQHFVDTSAKWQEVVLKNLPELDITSLVKSIEKEVFWPRNRILHGGTPANALQAERSVKIARLCLEIFREMDYETRKIPLDAVRQQILSTT